MMLCINKILKFLKCLLMNMKVNYKKHMLM